MKSLDDLVKRFEQWQKNIDNNIMDAQRQTAQQIWEDVITYAPVKTGEYIASIDIDGPTKEENEIKTFIGSDLTVEAKSTNKSYNLGYLLEHGTMPHDIYPVDSNYLVFEIDGKTIFTKHVFHPGTTAQPHYRLALEKNRKLYKDNIRRTWRSK